MRVLYVPVPRAGSTALLWALSELAGLRPEDFAGSLKLEMTRALTIHDTTVWGSHRLEGRSEQEIARILESDDWLRMTVVREPVRRLWSGWVSKVLVRDPRFSDVAPERPVPSSSHDVLQGFRAFVRELAGRPDWHDPHWASQADLIGVSELSYDHVGRVESLGRTVALLTEHVALRGRALPQLRHENAAVIPYSPGVFDESSLAAGLAWTASDREAFDYDAPDRSAPPDATWHLAVEAAIPAIQAIAERNERIADLRRQLVPTTKR